MHKKHRLKDTINLDPRTDGWFLMSSPFPTLAIVASYIYFVKSLGPKLMKDVPAFDLKSVIIIYNIFQVLFSTYIVVKVYEYVKLNLNSRYSSVIYLNSGI